MDFGATPARISLGSERGRFFHVAADWKVRAPGWPYHGYDLRSSRKGLSLS